MVGGWDLWSSSGAFDELVVEAGFEVVVVVAVGVDVVESGFLVGGPGSAVVVLGGGAVAAFDDAGGVVPEEGDLLGCGDSATEVADVGDVDTVRDDEFENGVSEELPGGGDGDGSDAGDFAEFVVSDGSAGEGFEVDADERQMFGAHPRRRHRRGWRRFVVAGSGIAVRTGPSA